MNLEYDQTKFSDPSFANFMIERISKQVRQLEKSSDGEICSSTSPVRIMEVCGTHTVSIFRSGLRSIFDCIGGIDLLSGPGCPVCVTPTADIDCALEIASNPDVIFTTFGDMLKVPGTKTTLSNIKAKGADIRIVYSPIELIDISQNTNKQVVFFSVGFETTTPGIAYSIKKSKALGIDNLTLIVTNKLVPPALNALCTMDDMRIHGFILPGHVSSIIGIDAYRAVAEMHRKPAVVTGFEPLEILLGVSSLLEQFRSNTSKIESAYSHAVPQEGNRHALIVMSQVFQSCDTEWRGLGFIPMSGLEFVPQYEQFNAYKKFGIERHRPVEHSSCRCGDVLTGRIKPVDCPLFGNACTTENPIGACMVSSEGTCAAYYKYSETGYSIHG